MINLPVEGLRGPWRLLITDPRVDNSPFTHTFICCATFKAGEIGFCVRATWGAQGASLFAFELNPLEREIEAATALTLGTERNEDE